MFGDLKKLNIIKNVYPNFYICNINGKVIMEEDN